MPVPHRRRIAPTAASLAACAALAEHTAADRRDGLRQTLSDMAGAMSAAGARAVDAGQRATVEEIAGTLATGAREPDPRSFVNGDFTTIAQRIDRTCRPG